MADPAQENSENVAETAEVASPPQPEVTDAQPVNADAENPPSGDAVTEESLSQPVDEVSPGGGVAEAASVVAEGDGTGQIQGEGEEGEGEKPDVEDETKPAQEVQDNFEQIEEQPDENAPIPENEAIPEADEGPAVELAQPLSREGTPTGDQTVVDNDARQEEPDASATPPPPVSQSPEPTTDVEPLESYIESDPMRYDEMEIDEESEPEMPIYNRAELIERYQQALEERSSLQALNAQLQHKLAEYFKKKKSDERQQEIEKNVTDQEQRYLKYMSNLEELQNEEGREKESYEEQIEDLKAKCKEKQEIVNRSSDNFMLFKMDVAKQAINSRSGKAIPPKDLEQYQMMELKKEQEVMQVRLENIKLKNRLKKREMQLKAKEELAEGLHLIDFEQLKIENQTYNEKIEERNEELLKLRKKITTTVQVLTHLKEKLQFVQAENSEQRSSLRTVEAHAAQKRDILTRTKQVRDALRIENVKLRQKCGLLGNEPLLRDYEQRKEQSDDLREKINRLKMAHAELTMNCSGVRTKIEGARLEEKQL
ncbi:Coiled-coil domain-containing protein 96 [Porites harrisoni]